MCILAMKKRKRPYKSHRWGMHGDVQQPRMLMSANIFKHFGKYAVISQRPYLVPPAVPVAFISMVLLHLLSARTLEPVWERISERWGASRWPWQKFSDQQNWNENISRLKTVQIFCRFIGKRSVLNCSHVYSLQTIGHLCSSFSPPFTGRSSRQSRAG